MKILRLFILCSLFLFACNDTTNNVSEKNILSSNNTEFVADTQGMNIGDIFVHSDHIYLEYRSQISWKQWYSRKIINREEVTGYLFEYFSTSKSVEQAGMGRYSVFGVDDDYMYFDNIRFSKSDSTKEYLDFTFHIPTIGLTAILPDKDELWIGSLSGGVNRYSKALGTSILYSTKSKPISIVNNYIYDIRIDDNHVCIIGGDGIDIYNKLEDRWINYKTDHLGFENSLDGSKLTMEWFEDNVYKIYRFDLEKGTFAKYLDHEFDHIASICINDSILYILSQNELYIFEDKSLKHSILRSDIEEVTKTKIKHFNSIEIYNNDLLIGTDIGLFILEKSIIHN